MNLKNLRKSSFKKAFHGWGLTGSRLEPLQGGSLLFTTKFPELPGIHFNDLGKMKSWVDHRATQWFWTQDPWTLNPVPWPLGLNRLGKAYYPLGKMDWSHREFCPCHRKFGQNSLKYMCLVYLCKSIAIFNEPKKPTRQQDVAATS